MNILEGKELVTAIKHYMQKKKDVAAEMHYSAEHLSKMIKIAMEGESLPDSFIFNANKWLEKQNRLHRI